MVFIPYRIGLYVSFLDLLVSKITPCHPYRLAPSPRFPIYTKL